MGKYRSVDAGVLGAGRHFLDSSESVVTQVNLEVAFQGFSELDDGWCNGSGVRISQSVMSIAMSVFTDVRGYLESIGIDPDKFISFVSPTEDGGVEFVWVSDGRKLCFGVNSSRENPFTFRTYNAVTGSESFGNTSICDMLVRLEWVIKGGDMSWTR